MAPSKNILVTKIIDSLTSNRDKPFLMSPDESLNRGQFLARVAERQEQMKRAGIEKGARILIFGGRGVTHWADVVAVWGMGYVCIPVNYAIEAEPLKVIVDLVNPSAAVGEGEAAKDLPDNVPVLPEIGDGKATSDFAIEAKTNQEDVSTILLTSGSTGRPKGATLPEAVILGNSVASLECMGFEADDCLYFSIPFNFTSAVAYFVATAITGAALYATEERLIFADLFKALVKSGATCFGGSPIQLRWIAECASQQPIRLRWMMSSGDRLPPEAIAKIRTALPDTKILTVYGFTEVGGRFCFLPPEMIDEHAGSVGRPINGLSLAVLDDDGKSVPPGQTGEIYVNGDHLMTAYYNDPETTAESLLPYGFRSRDLGFIDENGLLYLTGRVDDVFKVNGQKVSSILIADALMGLNIFADVAVTSYEDSTLGTVPVAFYVLGEGAGYDKKTVLGHLRDLLPDHSLPRKFCAVESVPRTGSGKIMRAELRKLAESL